MLKVRWQTPDNLPFPMPLDVRVDGKVVTLPMTGGAGETPAGEQAAVTIDPCVEDPHAVGRDRQVPSVAGGAARGPAVVSRRADRVSGLSSSAPSARAGTSCLTLHLRFAPPGRRRYAHQLLEDPTER